MNVLSDMHNHGVLTCYPHDASKPMESQDDYELKKRGWRELEDMLAKLSQKQ